MGKTIIPLDDLLNETAGYVSAFGREHPVAVVNAAEYQTLISYNWASGEVAPLLIIVARVVPSITDEERARLPVKAIAKLLSIAMGTAEEVEAALPLSSAPTPDRPTPASASGSPAS